MATFYCGFGAILVWASIALSNLLARRSYIKQGGDVKDLKFKTPLYPFVPLLALVLNVTVIVGMAFIPEQKNGVILWNSIYDCLLTVLPCDKK